MAKEKWISFPLKYGDDNDEGLIVYKLIDTNSYVRFFKDRIFIKRDYYKPVCNLLLHYIHLPDILKEDYDYIESEYDIDSMYPYIRIGDGIELYDESKILDYKERLKYAGQSLDRFRKAT